MAKGKVRVKHLKRPQAIYAPAVSPVSIAVSKANEVYKMREYGKGNKLPHDILRVFLASPTARGCINMLADFIEADGFANLTAAAVQVNPNQRADALLSLVAWDIAIMKGFALRVLFNYAGEISEVYHVPVQTVRRLEDGRFVVNPGFGGSSYKKEKDEILDAFGSPITAIARIDENGELIDEQAGQLLYVYRETSAQPYYPEPDAWAAREDIESDTQIQRADYNAITKRVKPNIGVFIPGNISDENPDENGKTDADYVEEEVMALTSMEGEGDPVVFFGNTKEEAPQLLEMPGIKASLPMDQKSDTIRRRICMAFDVHPALIGMETAGKLGNTQELQNIIQLTQQKVLRSQGMIQRAFALLFPNFDWTLSSLNILKTLPDQIWQTFDENERRNYLGLAEVETDEELQRFNRLPDLLKTKVLESMTPEQVLKLTGFSAEEENKPQPKALKPKQKQYGAIERGFFGLRAFLQKHLPD